MCRPAAIRLSLRPRRLFEVQVYDPGVRSANRPWYINPLGRRQQHTSHSHPLSDRYFRNITPRYPSTARNITLPRQVRCIFRNPPSADLYILQGMTAPRAPKQKVFGVPPSVRDSQVAKEASGQDAVMSQHPLPLSARQKSSEGYGRRAMAGKLPHSRAGLIA